MSKQASGTFYLLLDLTLFFEQYHNEQVDRALDIIKQLKILPLSLDSVEQKVNSFRYYEDEVGGSGSAHVLVLACSDNSLTVTSYSTPRCWFLTPERDTMTSPTFRCETNIPSVHSFFIELKAADFCVFGGQLAVMC